MLVANGRVDRATGVLDVEAIVTRNDVLAQAGGQLECHAAPGRRLVADRVGSARASQTRRHATQIGRGQEPSPRQTGAELRDAVVAERVRLHFGPEGRGVFTTEENSTQR